MNNASKSKIVLLLLGLIIVIGSHIYMLVAGLSESQMAGHAVVNLVAAGLIIFAWTKRS